MYKSLNELNIDKKYCKNLTLLPGFNIPDPTYTYYNKITNNSILEDEKFITLINKVNINKENLSRKKKVILKKLNSSRKKK